jgi:uncharacterized protein YdaU (DUF1376 family)
MAVLTAISTDKDAVSICLKAFFSLMMKRWRQEKCSTFLIMGWSL